MKYIRGTRNLQLILSDNRNVILKWCVGGYFAVHPNMRGHTGVVISGGRGSPIFSSIKYKLNTRSSTETDIVRVDDCNTAVLWTIYWLNAQGYGVFENIVNQDNKSAIILENNGKASSSKSKKHITIRYYFVTDHIEKDELSLEWCPTAHMIGYFMIKPTQGAAFNR